jgi:aspartate aminotransferase-like enzyme
MGIILLPGPVELEENVRDALATSVKNWDSKEFFKIYTSIQTEMKNILDCDYVLVISTPEQHALQMLLTSMFDEKDSLLVLSNGFYGGRVTNIAALSNANVLNVQVEKETPITFPVAKNYIDERKGQINGIVLNYVEASTGMRNQILEIAEYAKEKGLYTIVNGISAIGSEEFDMREWLVDGVVCASHHGLGMPPGLSFIGLSNDAMDKIQKVSKTMYFDDLKNHLGYLAKEEIPFTPAVNLYFAADVALQNIKRVGIEEWILRQKMVAKYVRSNLQNQNLKVFAPEEYASNGITTFFIENAQLVKNLLYKEYGIEIADGIGDLKNKTLRIGHMGAVSQTDYALFFDALEEIIKEAQAAMAKK